MFTHLFIHAALSMQDKPVERKHTLTGHVERFADFESKTLGNKRGIWVYTPPGYADSKESYPVLYMHDGQNIFDGYTSFIPNQEWRADEAAEALINAKMIKPIIIVGIENAGADRANEYLPTRAKMGDTEAGGRADQYGKFISDELMPWVSSHYRVKTGPKNTGMIGSSFGGIITLYLGLKEPTRYGKLGVVSPSVWWDNKSILGWVKKQKKSGSRMWVDMGTSEGFRTVMDSRDLVGALEGLGFTQGKDLSYYEDGYAQHNELAWSRRIGLMMYWLFKD